MYKVVNLFLKGGILHEGTPIQGIAVSFDGTSQRFGYSFAEREGDLVISQDFDPGDTNSPKNPRKYRLAGLDLTSGTELSFVYDVGAGPRRLVVINKAVSNTFIPQPTPPLENA